MKEAVSVMRPLFVIVLRSPVGAERERVFFVEVFREIGSVVSSRFGTQSVENERDVEFGRERERGETVAPSPWRETRVLAKSSRNGIVVGRRGFGNENSEDKLLSRVCFAVVEFWPTPQRSSQ